MLYQSVSSVQILDTLWFYFTDHVVPLKQASYAVPAVDVNVGLEMLFAAEPPPVNGTAAAVNTVMHPPCAAVNATGGVIAVTVTVPVTFTNPVVGTNVAADARVDVVFVWVPLNCTWPSANPAMLHAAAMPQTDRHQLLVVVAAVWFQFKTNEFPFEAALPQTEASTPPVGSDAAI